MFSAPAHAKRPKLSSLSCDGFTSHGEIGDIFADYESAHPEICRALTLGVSVGGRSIHGIRITADIATNGAKPGIRIVGGVHGDECMGAEIALAVAEWLVSSYGDDPVASDLVDGADIVVVPLVNPDGFESSPASRLNGNGVDLNRNFGFAWVPSLGGGAAPFSEPESRALRDLSAPGRFAVGLTYHTVTFDVVVNSPWNHRPEHPADAALFEEMGAAYGDATLDADVVFGWDWYMITGDVNDWSLGAAGTLDWTVELTSDAPDDATSQWEDIHEVAVKSFLPYALRGVSGTVVDAVTGEPLAARIRVAPEGEPVFTVPRRGDYHRILRPGTYDITAEANGYLPQTAVGVVVDDENPTERSFALVRGGDFAALSVNRMEMSSAIFNGSYTAESYLNDTVPTAALGPPDGDYYSLGPGGSITLDMGPDTTVIDRSGADLEIASGTGSEDAVAVYAAESEDGPFLLVAEGKGDLLGDLAATGLEEARFVRVLDKTTGPFNEPAPGYDLDAIINRSLTQDAGPDSDSDVDTDSDSDSDVDTDSEEEMPFVHDTSCGCDVLSKKRGSVPCTELLCGLF